jgi:hypothetical protein
LDKQIREALQLSATAPQERKEQVKPRWTLKRLVEWVKTEFTANSDQTRYKFDKL